MTSFLRPTASSSKSTVTLASFPLPVTSKIVPEPSFALLTRSPFTKFGGSCDASSSWMKLETLSPARGDQAGLPRAREETAGASSSSRQERGCPAHGEASRAEPRRRIVAFFSKCSGGRLRRKDEIVLGSSSPLRRLWCAQ